MNDEHLRELQSFWDQRADRELDRETTMPVKRLTRTTRKIPTILLTIDETQRGVEWPDRYDFVSDTEGTPRLGSITYSYQKTKYNKSSKTPAGK